MSTALAERDAPSITPEQLDLIKRTVANGATDAELKLFLFDCQRRGVHPLDKLIHFTKRDNRYTPVTSIDFMRSQAAMSGEMAGSDDAVFLVDPEDQVPVAATVTVYRMTEGQRFPYTATARWAEYCPDPGASGKGDRMWRRMPHTMLGKCAEALALRKAFPQQLAGLYSREEMDQADSQAPVSLASPLVVMQREAVPSVPNGGDSGTSIDTETGEVRPERPAGFHYISGYTFRNGWHEFTVLNFQADGGPFKLSTKKNIGHIAGEAFSESLPVKVGYKHKANSVGEGYLETIQKYAPPRPEPGVPDEMLKDADIPF